MRQQSFWGRWRMMRWALFDAFACWCLWSQPCTAPVPSTCWAVGTDFSATNPGDTWSVRA